MSGGGKEEVNASVYWKIRLARRRKLIIEETFVIIIYKS